MSIIPDGLKHETSKNIIESLMKSCNVKLLALDFDRTIISIHTGGHWNEGVEKLVPHVRECFRKLIKAALKMGLQVAVVTFSMQSDLIRDVLRAVLSADSGSDRIIVKGGDSIMPAGAGKELHLKAVIDELGANVLPDQILLIDDDEENIAIARRHQHRVYHVRSGEVSLQDIDDYVRSLEKDMRTQHS